jgi:hypothetical protein
MRRRTPVHPQRHRLGVSPENPPRPAIKQTPEEGMLVPVRRDWGWHVRIVMTLLVRDEADIVAATVEHHLAAGVDFVVATDNGSVDGTTEILERYRDAGVLELRHEPNHDYEQSRWVTAMARRAAESHGADWVISGDADEFLWPGTATGVDRIAVSDALAAVDSRCGTVEMVRDNLVADPARSGPWPSTHVLRDTLSLSARGTRIGNKVCHRADPG